MSSLYAGGVRFVQPRVTANQPLRLERSLSHLDQGDGLP